MQKLTSYITVEGKKAKPTKKHRAAIWENILGTVYARNSEGETKYFDYDWKGAIEFAGVPENPVENDVRIFRFPEEMRFQGGPFVGQRTLFVRKG